MPGEHGHHGHDHGRPGSRAGANLKLAFLLNLAFTAIEVAGGLWTNSIAVLSDAVHDFGDSMSLGLAWYFERLSRRGRTARSTYGQERYSLLGGLITALTLLVGLGFVLWHSLLRLLEPQPVHAHGMLLLAALGIAFNGAAVLRMRGGTSLTERVVSWHLLEDTLGWAAVLVGAAIMSVWDVPVLDPLLSIGIAAFVLVNVVRSLRSFFDVFLQKVPPGFNVAQFDASVRDLPGVMSVHHTHCWSIDGERHVLTTHVVMRAAASRQEQLAVKAAIRGMLDTSEFTHVTVDVELQGEACVSPGHAAEPATRPSR